MRTLRSQFVNIRTQKWHFEAVWSAIVVCTVLFVLCLAFQPKPAWAREDYSGTWALIALEAPFVAITNVVVYFDVGAKASGTMFGASLLPASAAAVTSGVLAAKHNWDIEPAKWIYGAMWGFTEASLLALALFPGEEGRLDSNKRSIQFMAAAAAGAGLAFLTARLNRAKFQTMVSFHSIGAATGAVLALAAVVTLAFSGSRGTERVSPKSATRFLVWSALGPILLGHTIGLAAATFGGGDEGDNRKDKEATSKSGIYISPVQSFVPVCGLTMTFPL